MRMNDISVDPDFQFLLNSSNIICIGGADGLAKLINPKFIQVTGWTEDDILGKSFIHLLHPDDVETTKAALTSIADSSKPIHVESKIRCKDDSFRWFSWNIIKKNQLFYCIATDITDQLAKEEELSKNKLTSIDYKKILETVFDQIVVTDPDGIVLFANGAIEAITGFSKSEVLGSKAGTYWGKQMNTEYYEHLWSVIKNEKKIFYGRLTNKRNNGELYEAEIKIFPVLTEDNEIEYFVSVERDISKESELEKLTQITIDRELRMSELKEELKKIKNN